MDELKLIYLTIQEILYRKLCQITAPRILKKKLFWTIRLQENIQLKLCSDFFKNTCEGVYFKKRPHQL